MAPVPPVEPPFGAYVVQAAGPLLTVAEVATRLRVSLATVYRMVRSDALRVVRVSNSIRVPTEELGRALSRPQGPGQAGMP